MIKKYILKTNAILVLMLMVCSICGNLSAHAAKNDFSIYFCSGIGLNVGWADNFRIKLDRHFKSLGKNVYMTTCFPYGEEKDRKLAGQIWDVGSDLVDEDKAHKSDGGQYVVNYVKNNYNGGKLIFIGYSGGGIAGYHAARILESSSYDVAKVFCIGSPKVQISPCMKDRVVYMTRTDDKIFCYFGTFMPDNKKLEYELSPGAIVRLNTSGEALGGHYDYFRGDLPEKGSPKNTEVVLNKMIPYLP